MKTLENVPCKGCGWKYAPIQIEKARFKILRKCRKCGDEICPQCEETTLIDWCKPCAGCRWR